VGWVTSPWSLLQRLQAASSEPDYHVLQYTYVPDILEKRGPYRAEHLEGAKKMVRLILCMLVLRMP